MSCNPGLVNGVEDWNESDIAMSAVTGASKVNGALGEPPGVVGVVLTSHPAVMGGLAAGFGHRTLCRDREHPADGTGPSGFNDHRNATGCGDGGTLNDGFSGPGKASSLVTVTESGRLDDRKDRIVGRSPERGRTSDADDSLRGRHLDGRQGEETRQDD